LQAPTFEPANWVYHTFAGLLLVLLATVLLWRRVRR